MVEVGVGVEADQRPGALGPLGDEEGHVVDRADGQQAGGGGAAGEVEAVVVAHDVDHDVGQQGRFVGHGQLAGEFLTGESAVPQRAAHFGRDGADEGADRHVGGDGQAERHDVGGHADDVPQAAVPTVGGQSHGDVLGPGGPADVGGDRAHQNGAPAGTAGGGQPAQVVEDGDGQGLAGVHVGVDRNGRGRSAGAPADEGGAATLLAAVPGSGRVSTTLGGQVGEPARPVDAVGLVPVGAAVGGLVVQELA